MLGDGPASPSTTHCDGRGHKRHDDRRNATAGRNVRGTRRASSENAALCSLQSNAAIYACVHWSVVVVESCPHSHSKVRTSALGVSGWLSLPTSRIVRLQPGHSGSSLREGRGSSALAPTALPFRLDCAPTRYPVVHHHNSRQALSVPIPTDSADELRELDRVAARPADRHLHAADRARRRDGGMRRSETRAAASSMASPAAG